MVQLLQYVLSEKAQCRLTPKKKLALLSSDALIDAPTSDPSNAHTNKSKKKTKSKKEKCPKEKKDGLPGSTATQGENDHYVV